MLLFLTVMPSHNPSGLLTYKLMDWWPSFTCPGLCPDQQFDQIPDNVEDWNSYWNYSKDSTVSHGCGKDPVHHLKTKGIPTWHTGQDYARGDLSAVRSTDRE
jgi:hypothetical protein